MKRLVVVALVGLAWMANAKNSVQYHHREWAKEGLLGKKSIEEMIKGDSVGTGDSGVRFIRNTYARGIWLDKVGLQDMLVIPDPKKPSIPLTPDQHDRMDEMISQLEEPCGVLRYTTQQGQIRLLKYRLIECDLLPQLP